MLCAKNRSEKHLMLSTLKIRQNWEQYAWAIAHGQNGQFGLKIKNAKKVRKTILRPHYSCCVQKTAPKNT